MKALSLHYHVVLWESIEKDQIIVEHSYGHVLLYRWLTSVEAQGSHLVSSSPRTAPALGERKIFAADRIIVVVFVVGLKIDKAH